MALTLTMALVGAGEINLETIAQAQPDLIVTAIYPTDRAGTLDSTQPYYGFKDLEQQEKLAAIAPIVAIKVGGMGIEVIESNTKLALALGADQAKVDADADGIYLVKPEDEPETQLHKSLGLKYTDLNPDGDYYWDIYSWENAGKVKSGDVILLSNEGFQQADLLKQATFADDPALVAGQVHERRVTPLGYSSQAKSLDHIAGILSSSKDV